jgi:DNA relaxase NicK
MLSFYGLKQLWDLLRLTFEEVRINRIDTAFDYCPFTVQDVLKEVKDNNLRSYFKRETVTVYDKPYEPNELGKIGTSGINLGGRSSTRYIRIYDKHGYTRLEIEYKGTKSQQVGADLLFSQNPDAALELAIGHLRDYIDFFSDWWEEFIMNFDRLFKTLPKEIQEMTMEGIKNWFENQVASAFFVLSQLEGSEYWNNLIRSGSVKYRKSKYFGILEVGKC